MLTPRALEIRSLLLRHDRGDATLEELAAEAGIRPTTLRWWRSRLRQSGALADPIPSTSFVELPRSDDAPAAPPARSEPFTVALSDLRITVPVGFDGDELHRLIGVLRGC